MAGRKTAINRLNHMFEDATEVGQEEVIRLEAVHVTARTVKPYVARSKTMALFQRRGRAHPRP
jgi:hypothetical protein